MTKEEFYQEALLQAMEMVRPPMRWDDPEKHQAELKRFSRSCDDIAQELTFMAFGEYYG